MFVLSVGAVSVANLDSLTKLIMNPKISFIGFSSSKKYVHINCLPCCFKNEGKFKKKITECNISHPVKKLYKPPQTKYNPDLSHVMTRSIIPYGKFGHLDDETTGKLNDFFNNGLI